VVFEFKRPYSPGLRVVGEQPIAPAHVFEKLPHPLTDPNENPVATGPFTVIKSFSPTLYEVTRNEKYWQRDKVKIAGFRVPLFRGNQEAIAALMDGQVDWGSIFIPNAESTFVARDPLHNKVWYAPFGEPILLYFNTTRKPFDDKHVRRALSMSFDRGRIVKEAMNGYAPVLDATGLSQETYLPWKDFAQVKRGTWTRYDPAAAKAELERAGLRAGPDGMRRAGASPVRCTIDVIEGWNDWIAAARIIADGMRAVGIEAELKAIPHPVWLEKVETGDFEASIAAGTGGATPYNFYRSQMSSALVKPAGTRSQENWHRYGSREADAALVAFEAEVDNDRRKALASKLQEIYVENAPALPLFTGPVWGEYTETRFRGFPNKENPYARLAPYLVERLLVMMELRPSNADRPAVR
jgi:peptide/nickel transport system substrate-binding protein